ncbi:hypothetical protein J3F83DRAFT_768450 [Trichoderma novae-zelandiae]
MITPTASPIHCENYKLIESSNDTLPQAPVDVLYRTQLAFNPDKLEAVEKCVHNVIMAQTLIHPDRVAVSSWDMKLTYKELDERSTLLALYLSDMGVGPEKLVCLCFEKSAWTIIAMLAVMKAGGAFVPMDPAFPEMRKKQIMGEVDTDIVLVSPLTKEKLAGSSQQLVVVCQELLDSIVTDKPLHDTASPSNAAYVIFTSGSTGKPKGILVEHRNFCSGVKGHAVGLGFMAGYRVLQVSSYVFDASLTEILTTLMIGGCVCVPDDDTKANDLVGFINRESIDHAVLTPSFCRTIQPSSVPSLRTLVLAGEAMRSDDIQLWADKLRLINGYGPSECSVCCSSNANITLDSSATDIGKAISTSRCWIADPDNHDQLLAPGCDGELLVQGPTLARGYLNDKQRTANTFIDAPKWLRYIEGDDAQYSRLYKTGDIVRYDANGSLIFVGRKDTQVKLRGQRISLPEIENQLLKHDEVHHGLVLFPRSGPFSGRLVAVIHTVSGCDTPGPSDVDIQFYAGSDKRNELISSIDSHLAKTLAAYMVPTVYAMLASVPLLPSGKLNRNKVLSYITTVPESAMSTFANSMLQASIIPAANSLAMALSERVASLLSQHVDDSLYSVTLGYDVGLVAAGIDSISGISLRKYILETYETAISVETILNQETTISTLAKLIRTGGSGKNMNMDANFDVELETGRCLGDWMSEVKPRSPEYYQQKLDGYKTVFLTGATGYLGSHILLELLNRSEVTRVILHVRADNKHHAKARIIAAAMAAGWWTDEFEPKMETWVGDLSEPKLGLSDELWSKLKEGEIDSIIHNGCEVNWHKDYNSLKPTNVSSTFALLQVVEQAVMPINFVYVSARRHGLAIDEAEPAFDETMGYIQTKLVSENLILEYLKRDPSRQQDFTIARPGLVIGTPTRGIANMDDFIWRLVAGSIQTKTFPVISPGGWLCISDAGSVSSRIASAGIYGSRSGNTPVDFDDGMPVEDFWDCIASAANTELRGMGKQDWIATLVEHVEAHGSDSPLWAVQYFLPYTGQLFESRPSNKDARAESIQEAVKQNVKYLMEVGYLGGKHGLSTEAKSASRCIFNRKKKAKQ